MSHEPVPLHPLREADEEHIGSPRSADEPPPLNLRQSPLNKMFDPRGYDRVDLYDGDITSSTKDESSTQSQARTRGSTDSLGIYPDHKASSGSLRRKPVAASPPPQVTSPLSSSTSTPHAGQNLLDSPAASNKSPRARSMWGSSPRFKNIFEKLLPKKRLPRGVKPPVGSVYPPESSSPGQSTSTAPNLDMEPAGDSFDDEAFYQKFGEPPSYCCSRKNIEQKTDWISRTIMGLAIYSTIMSGIWLVLPLRRVSFRAFVSSKPGHMKQDAAATLTAFIAKTIELSFVTVFVFCLGQILTRRAFLRRARGGMTLADMTMRNWIIQPGSIATHHETIPYSARTLLGILTLVSTLTSTLYTTASDALVSPKLMTFVDRGRTIVGPVSASYANVHYLKRECPDMYGAMPRDLDNDNACAEVQFSGQSHRNLFAFMSTWAGVKANGTASPAPLAERPPGKHSLYENTTMTAAWIETGHGNVTANFKRYGRIINNVTMAMPHPGVYAAARNPYNDIIQPEDLSGVGGYTVYAGVVSPALNVMCVNVKKTELAPLIYPNWPNSNSSRTGYGDQRIGHKGWEDDVPLAVKDGKPNYLNRTVMDDVFRWGPKYDRRPPVFTMYPFDFNMVANSTVAYSDAIYILAKKKTIADYTLCELRSWVSPLCTTIFKSSGIIGTSMEAHCEDPNDENAYHRSYPKGQDWPEPAKEWRDLGHTWRMALDINGGERNNNASNARQLTQLILEEPRLKPDLPSFAEALAVFGGSSLVASSLKSPYRHHWQYQSLQLPQSKEDRFNATLKAQEYIAGTEIEWQKIMYLVLGITFLLNFVCLLWLFYEHDMVTDFTEPQNLFTLAMNSPPTQQLRGSCGGGPEGRDLMVPWRVSYAPSANHYFFEEANDRPWRGKYAHDVVTTARPVEDTKSSSYKRLSTGRGWL